MICASLSLVNVSFLTLAVYGEGYLLWVKHPQRVVFFVFFFFIDDVVSLIF